MIEIKEVSGPDENGLKDYQCITIKNNKSKEDLIKEHCFLEKECLDKEGNICRLWRTLELKSELNKSSRNNLGKKDFSLGKLKKK